MKIKKRPLVNRPSVQKADLDHEPEFREVVDLIRNARQRALQAVNTSLVDLYWKSVDTSAGRSKRLFGVTVSLINWPVTSRVFIRIFAGSSVAICSACASFMRCTKTTKPLRR
jgi:hypothetical protein